MHGWCLLKNKAVWMFVDHPMEEHFGATFVGQNQCMHVIMSTGCHHFEEVCVQVSLNSNSVIFCRPPRTPMRV